MGRESDRSRRIAVQIDGKGVAKAVLLSAGRNLNRTSGCKEETTVFNSDDVPIHCGAFWTRGWSLQPAAFDRGTCPGALMCQFKVTTAEPTVNNPPASIKSLPEFSLPYTARADCNVTHTRCTS